MLPVDVPPRVPRPRRRVSRRLTWIVVGLMLVGVGVFNAVRADVLRVEVDRRTPVLDGASMGPYGAYELIEGRIWFGVDPAHPMNDRIHDLEYAPRDSLGRVVAWTSFVVLQPVSREKRRGIALVEVSNRGRKAALRYFSRATAPLDAATPDAFGDRLLMREGLTIIWLGWQWDVPRTDDVLRLHVPIARHVDGSPIRGLVRSDWVVDDSTRVLPMAHRDHVAYPVADADDPANVLTVRTGRDAPRRVVPRERWRFARLDASGRVVADSTHVYLPDGATPGRIYELVYRAEHPRVVGLGLAAIRDVIAYAKYDPDAVFPVDQGVAVGISQTGRFLRHFLYEGFNTDEAGRQAYDGTLILTAGAGRGSFNHRFAQPSRDAHRYSAFDYPTDLFPFTSRTQFDAEQVRSDGLLAHHHRERHVPKTIVVNTGYEYWGRAASLVHTTPDGRTDVAPAEEERIYHVASAQHFPWLFPPPEDNRLRDDPDLYRGNPLDQSVLYRAMLVQLVNWVDGEGTPPPSRIPRRADSTLVAVDSLDFPALPGVDVPGVVHTAHRMDYGPRFRTDGVVTRQPPHQGPAFPSLVSQVDSLGNERAGVRLPEVRVPLATYTPWHLRLGAPANPDEIDDFYGSFVPLPLTPDEKTAWDDPRPSIRALYPSRDAYLGRVRDAADALIQDGFLLTIDRERVLDRAAATWDWLVP